ncbi:hypothetical protein UCRNP2_7800 [Neofusicoccum parvum UCRNP2]|uniref:Uncharacterized protein n=2 Tax=Neofusicoccum parvum TaxID=310453 RepID=R1GHT6_BOTPV|nr:hypothetical protein UCRNP2_7800 [Neofusicoccum parvum UCRNP2]GME25124.1 uncharacterized protein LTHEOB_2607 [Neofusicoccum parvum]
MSGFSEREVQLMACAFQAMKTPPEIDYSVMARLAGMTNPGSASNAMRAIRKKLDARVPGGIANGNSAPNTPKKTPRTATRKRPAAVMETSFFDDEAEADAAESPSTKKSKTASATSITVGEDRVAVRVKKENRDEDDEETEDDEYEV